MEEEEILQRQSHVQLKKPPPFYPSGRVDPAIAAAAEAEEAASSNCIKNASVLTEESSASPAAASLPLHSPSMTSSPRSAELASSEVSTSMLASSSLVVLRDFC
jgi:hypothetical protein